MSGVEITTGGPPPPPRSKKNRKPAPRHMETHSYNDPDPKYNPYAAESSRSPPVLRQPPTPMSAKTRAEEFPPSPVSTVATAPPTRPKRTDSRFDAHHEEESFGTHRHQDEDDDDMTLATANEEPLEHVNIMELEPETVIGESLIIEGKLQFDRLLRVDGKFAGELISQGDLIIGKTGEIVGEIRGMGVVVIFGKVMGSIAVEVLELREQASIYGNITCKRLTMDPTVVLVGQLNINPQAPLLVDCEGQVEKPPPEVVEEDPTPVIVAALKEEAPVPEPVEAPSPAPEEEEAASPAAAPSAAPELDAPPPEADATKDAPAPEEQPAAPTTVIDDPPSESPAEPEPSPSRPAQEAAQEAAQEEEEPPAPQAEINTE